MQLSSKNIFSLVIGIIVFAVGVLELAGVGFNYNWFTVVLPYLLAILGLYLGIEAIVELSSSNMVGWTSFFAGLLIMLLGIFNALQSFGIWSFFVIPAYVYPIVFILLGLFLVIATFAMEP